MDKPVNHEHNNPVFYKRDIVLTKLAVDKYVWTTRSSRDKIF